MTEYTNSAADATDNATSARSIDAAPRIEASPFAAAAVAFTRSRAVTAATFAVADVVVEVAEPQRR